MLSLRNPLLLLTIFAGVLACSAASSSEFAELELDSPAMVDDGLELPEASLAFVEIERVAARENAAILKAPASVAFRDGAVSRVGAPLAGKVEIVHVETGDQIKAGDPLVVLDCPDAASSRAALTTAQASQREAAAAVQRHNRMMEQGVGTERERLEAERRLAEADAELVRARAAAKFVGRDHGTTVVLHAPIDGTVLSRTATRGAAVEPGEPLIEIGDPSDLWVVADVFDRDLHLVSEQMPAQISLPSVAEPLTGRVVSLGAVVQGNARTAPVRIGLDPHAELLRPGMFGRVRIGSPEHALALPTTAVLIEDGETVVYVQTGPRTFARRVVVVGHPVEGRVVVRSGLTEGEPVVVRGALLLDGAADQLL